MLYKVLASLFSYVRDSVLPKPSDVLQEALMIGNYNPELIILAGLLGSITLAFIHKITYFVVGLFYTKGTFPLLGSFLYMFFYIIHMGLLCLIMSVYPSSLQITLILAGYIFILFAVRKFLNKIQSLVVGV